MLFVLRRRLSEFSGKNLQLGLSHFYWAPTQLISKDNLGVTYRWDTWDFNLELKTTISSIPGTLEISPLLPHNN